MSLKDLKNQIENEVRAYKQPNEDRLCFSVYYGTKNVEIVVNLIKNKQRPSGKVIPSRQMFMKIVSKLVRLEDGMAFVKFTKEVSKTIGYNNPEQVKVEKETVSEMIKYAIRYWKGYKKIKQLDALFIDNNFRNKELEEFFKNHAFNQQFKKLEGYHRTLRKPEKFNVFLGDVEKSFEEYVNPVIRLHTEIEELFQSEKTFASEVVEDKTHMFHLENKVYYYENAYFGITVGTDKVVIAGETIETLELLFKEGMGREILNYVSEQRSLVNLLHPPIRNIKMFFEDHLNAYFLDSQYERKVQELEGILGIGKVDENCVEIKNQFAFYAQMGRYNRGREHRENYKELCNDTFNYYCVKVADFYWHILIDKGYDFWMYPSDSNEYPDYIHNALKEVMIRAVKDAR